MIEQIFGNEYTLIEHFLTYSLKEVLSPDECSFCLSFYEKYGYDNVYQLGKKRKMLPYIASLLFKLNIDSAKWSEVSKKYRIRNLHIVHELDLLFAALQQAGANKIFVSENFGALLHSGRDLSLFSSGDIDICADISEKEIIYNVFGKLGYTIQEHYNGCELCITAFSHHNRLPENFYLSVCWKSLYREKLPCPINFDDYINWNSLRYYSNTQIKLPGTETLLYICLIHISLHSFNRPPAIRLYADILNCIYNKQVDWNLIQVWARKSKVIIRTKVSLLLAQKLLGLDIPIFILKDINNKSKKIISMVYDHDTKCLKSKSCMWQTYFIEILCNDNGILDGVANILYPDSNWLKERYGKNTFHSFLRHLRNLI